MTTTDITLNGVALSTAVPEAIVLDVDRPLVGAPRHSSVTIPGRAGALRFDEEPGERVFGFTIDVEADSFADRRAAFRALAAWAHQGTTTALIVDDEPDRYHDAILASSADVNEWLRHGSARLDFEVGPFSFSNTVSTEAIVAGTNPASGSFAVGGDTFADPVIEVTANGGTITSLTLTVNGFELVWAGAISPGGTITISSISDTVTVGVNVDVNLTGAFNPGDVSMADVFGLFPLLLTGTSAWSVSWTGTATSLDLDFSWRERTY